MKFNVTDASVITAPTGIPAVVSGDMTTAPDALTGMLIVPVETVVGPNNPPVAVSKLGVPPAHAVKDAGDTVNGDGVTT